MVVVSGAAPGLEKKGAGALVSGEGIGRSGRGTTPWSGGRYTGVESEEGL